MSARAPEPLPQSFPVRLAEGTRDGHDGRVAIVLATAGGALTGCGPWPATLVAEALAQAILLVERPRGVDDLRLVGLDGVSILQPLQAGDRLEVEVRELAAFGGLRRYRCRGLRGGALAAVADVTVSG